MCPKALESKYHMISSPSPRDKAARDKDSGVWPAQLGNRWHWREECLDVNNWGQTQQFRLSQGTNIRWISAWSSTCFTTWINRITYAYTYRHTLSLRCIGLISIAISNPSYSIVLIVIIIVTTYVIIIASWIIGSSPRVQIRCCRVLRVKHGVSDWIATRF